MVGVIGILACANNAIAPKIPPYRGEALQTPYESDTKATKRAILESFIPDPTNTQKKAIASIVGDNTDYLTKDEFKKLVKICLCESSLDESAICYAGWQGGMGLCGFIPKTWNYVLGKIETDHDLMVLDKCKVLFNNFNKEHPIFYSVCNWELAQWLYKHEGDGHWNSSKECWNK
jgi:hypothetical protein